MEQGNIKHICIDLETELIGAGRLAPLVACVSVYSKEEHTLLTPNEGAAYIAKWSKEHAKGWLIGHNIAFDLYALIRHEPRLAPIIWALYDEGRIYDTGIYERLYALYHGWGLHPLINKPIISRGVSLAQLAKGLCGIDMGNTKFDPDSPRFNYSALIDKPFAEWPDESREYALNDSRITYRVFEEQQTNLSKLTHFDTEKKELYSFTLQVQADWALHHLRAWGLRTSQDKVESWKLDLEQQKNNLTQYLKDHALLNEEGKRNMKAIRAVISAAYGPSAPKTEKGQIQTNNEVLEDSNEPSLQALAQWLSIDKLLNTFASTIESGVQYPISPRWNVLVRSGRTSCTKPNMQQLPQAGGVRECFTPRAGHCYVGADYSTAELVALAQICINCGIPSEMAKAIQNGQDLHLALAAELAGVTYQKALELKSEGNKEILKLRKLAKVPNFGLPGGLSANGLTSFAKGYGLDLSEQEAESLKVAWFKRWPEMKRYFAQVRRDVDKGHTIQHESLRRRGGVGFTDGANTYFQGLVADGAKTALYDVVRACFMEKDSLLFGCRPVLFIHDEIILEAPKNKAPEAADALAQVMVDAMKKFMPDLPIQADAWASMKWTKGLDSVRDDNGKLLIQFDI